MLSHDCRYQATYYWHSLKSFLGFLSAIVLTSPPTSSILLLSSRLVHQIEEDPVHDELFLAWLAHPQRHDSSLMFLGFPSVNQGGIAPPTRKTELLPRPGSWRLSSSLSPPKSSSYRLHRIKSSTRLINIPLYHHA